MVKISLIFIFLLLNSAVYANIAKVVAFKGNAKIIRNNQNLDVSINSILKKDDEIKTKNNTKVQILFKDETIITVGKNSHFKIEDYTYDKTAASSARFNFMEGSFRTITGAIGKIAPEKFKLQTKTSSIGIRGTQILNEISSKKEKIYCTEGTIEIVLLETNKKIILNAGEFIEIKYLDKKPIKMIIDNKNSVIVDTNTKFNLDDDINFDEIIGLESSIDFSYSEDTYDYEIIDDKISEGNGIQNDKLKDEFIVEPQNIDLEDEPEPEIEG